jgi:serine/threonine protein phosphatase 1
MKTFVMGDVPGAHKALVQCLERSGFDMDTDTLIQLGDVADGFDEVYDCVETLLTIPNLIAIQGNHDAWFADFIETGRHPENWGQGALATAKSYLAKIGKSDRVQSTENGFVVALNPANVPLKHQAFFRQQHLYYMDDANNCFVHGGFDRHYPFKGQMAYVYLWDRHLWSQALSFEATARGVPENRTFQMETPFNEIFIGHTTTMNWKTDQPMKAANIYNLDTGGGWGGRLTIIDLETKEFWQSDPVSTLYPDKRKYIINN